MVVFDRRGGMAKTEHGGIDNVGPELKQKSDERRNQVAMAMAKAHFTEHFADMAGVYSPRYLGNYVKQLEKLGIKNLTVEEMRQFVFFLSQEMNAVHSS